MPTPLVVISIPPAGLHRLPPDVLVMGLSMAATPEPHRDTDRLGSPPRGPKASPSPSRSACPNAGPVTMASGWHILVVDDEPDIRTMLRLLLEDEGYQVSEAADGTLGLAHLRASSHPVIVLLDYRMPRMNGEEMLAAVMADPQLANRHAFILVTANLLAFSPALHQLLAAAAIPVVQKPFRLSQILDAIEQAILRLRASADLPSSRL